MCNYLSIIMFLFSCCVAPVINAQTNLNYSFRHINQSDGLLHNLAFSIAQDSKGFIWVATSNGLQRYDGSRFIYYPSILTDPAEGLTPGAEIFADKKNNFLWVFKNSTLEKMDLVKNNSILYYPKKAITDTSFNFTSYTGNKNTQWMLSSNSVYSYDRVTKKIIVQQQNIALPPPRKASYIFTDSSSQQTWAAVASNLFLFDERTKTVFSSDSNAGHHPLLQSLHYNDGGYASRYVMVDSRNNIWVITWSDRIYRYDPITKKVTTYLLSGIKSAQQNKPAYPSRLIVNCVLEDDHNTIWMGTENAGLLRYNSEKDNFDYCIADEKNRDGLQYNYKIFSLFQDKEQNIWIGTDNGINIFNPYQQYFKTIRHQENTALTIAKSEIEAVTQIPAGDIFIGTWGNGIGVYDSDFTFKRNIIFKGPPENNFVWSFVQMNATTLWIGCQHGYLIAYDLVTGATQYMRPPEMEGFTILCMEKDNSGNIWFGLHNGKIIKWDRQENKFFPYGDPNVKRTSPVLNMFIDNEQRCWVSTESGFKEFDLDKRVYTNTWLPDKNNAYSLSGRSIQGIESLNDSTLLLGTIYGGINFFNTHTKQFTHLTAADGLPAEKIYAIKKDADGFIWFTTDYGLYKFNAAEKKFIPYSIEAGVITSPFKSTNFYALQNGEWLTLTTTEVVSFFPKKQQVNIQPRIQITGFKKFDTPIFIDSLLAANKPVQLSFKDNFFTVEFAALNFSNLQQTNYYYRLKGIDKDWVNGGTKRFANYTDLQPGEYTFDVRAEIGNSSSDTTSFKIIITPPFWKTLWFKILCVVIISAIIYAFAKWRINSIYKDERRKIHFTRQMAEMEMKALRSQMNPHFIFNCINSIDALIQSNDKYHATVYLNKFAKLLRNVLDSNKQNTVTFSKDIDTLKLYIELEELRHENKFKAVFQIDPELLNSDYKVPALIIQPFVENAILHGLKNKDGNEGLLTLTIRKTEDTLEYTITDNGIGREAAAHIMQNKDSHYGMDISYDRIKLFNKEETAAVQVKDLYVNGVASGTEVKVNLNLI